LEKREVSYPPDENGRQKIRSKIASGKSAFLVIVEDSKQVVIITGGEAWLSIVGKLKPIKKFSKSQ